MDTQLPQNLTQSPTPLEVSPVVPVEPPKTTPLSSKIEIIADKIKVNGPRLDNCYTVTLEVGEYEHGKIAQIMNIAQPTNFKVFIEEITGK